MSDCNFPGCNRIESRDGYCFLHAVHFAGPKVKEMPKPIAKESEKRKKEKVVYTAQVKAIIAENPNCRINSPDCTGKAQGANHKQKRSPANYTKIDNLEGACNACNLYCETHPVWAEANGHQISRFK